MNRADLRQRLEAIARANTSTQRLTSLGMHYMPAPDGTPVLVLVEVNVPRLLAVLCERVAKSKRGVASSGKGSVRVSLATPEAREICASVCNGSVSQL